MIVRNHKCSTTTMLSYVAQALGMLILGNNFTVIFKTMLQEYILNAVVWNINRNYLVQDIRIALLGGIN